MKKVSKVFIFIIIVLIVFLGIYFKNGTLGKQKLRLAVVEVSNWNVIAGMTKDGRLLEITLKDLESVGSYDKFKRGQEIEIYYDGVIITTYPGKITNVSKYEIIKENSDIEIPEEIIKRYDNSTENVMVHIREITNEKLNFRILDTNKIPYEYDFDYSLLKKNSENEEYNKKLQEKFKKEQERGTDGEKSKESTRNTTSETNSTKPFNPDTSQYKPVWERVNEKAIVSMDDVIKITDLTDGHLDMEGKINWKYIYETLEQGEYKFILKNKADAVHFNNIEFNFVVKDDGKVIYEPPTFAW